MKTKEFNQNFTIDTKTKRGIKAVSKGAGGFPEKITADNQIFNAENKYFFFDNSTRAVRDTTSLRRIDADWLGGFGLRIVRIEKLRAGRGDALSDAIGFFKSEIENLQETVADLEHEKTELN